ncbi:MAG TPA: flagellar basal body rod protein FlgB [bacterium]|jgi:flagellar basal-body rod protein FlgB
MADNLVEGFLIGQSTSTVVLKKTLDAQAMRQRAHTQNIANVETPGYRRVAVDFEGELKTMLASEQGGGLRTSDVRHMSTDGAGSLNDLSATARQETPDPEGSGVNGVNIDVEMAQMAETQLRYMTALELLKRRYTSLKSAIKGQ